MPDKMPGHEQPIADTQRVCLEIMLYPICCLRLSAFLPYQHRLANPVRNQIPVTSRIVFQQRLHLLRKLRSGKIGDLQLLAIQAFHGVNLPVEGGLERTSLCLGNQGLGDYLKGIIHDVGKKPRSLVEDGAVVEPAISGNHRNVVQVPIIVEDQTVDFKQQCQILGESGKSGDAGGFLCQIGHPLFSLGSRLRVSAKGFPVNWRNKWARVMMDPPVFKKL